MADLEKKPPLFYVALNTMKAYRQGHLTQYRRRQHELDKKKREKDEKPPNP